MNEHLSVFELELNIRLLNTLRNWKPVATIADLRAAMSNPDSSLHSQLRARDRKEIAEVLANVSAPPRRPDIFAHITAEAVKAERERSGRGIMEIKLDMQRKALLEHIASADTVDLRQVLTWLVERAR